MDTCCLFQEIMLKESTQWKLDKSNPDTGKVKEVNIITFLRDNFNFQFIDGKSIAIDHEAASNGKRERNMWFCILQNIKDNSFGKQIVPPTNSSDSFVTDFFSTRDVSSEFQMIKEMIQNDEILRRYLKNQMNIIPNKEKIKMNYILSIMKNYFVNKINQIVEMEGQLQMQKK